VLGEVVAAGHDPIVLIALHHLADQDGRVEVERLDFLRLLPQLATHEVDRALRFLVELGAWSPSPDTPPRLIAGRLPDWPAWQEPTADAQALARHWIEDDVHPDDEDA